MAEAVTGSFVFTILRDDNTLFLVKGDNPITLLHYPELGLYIYASTTAILTAALKAVKFSGVCEEVPINDGNIVRIDSDGKLSVSTFEAQVQHFDWHYLYRLYGYDYAEIRNASNMRFQVEAELTRCKNRIQRWFAVYFPEYSEVYGSFNAISSMMILKQAALPCDIINLGAEKINQIWRDSKLRAVGKKRAQTLVEAAQRSIGYTEGLDTARIEISLLLEDFERLPKRLEQIIELIEELVGKVPYAEKLLQIKGIGMKTVSGFIAEVGEISRFTNAKQLQKLAGLAIVENSSGKHNGKSRISKRGRKRLRYLLFEAVLSLTASNQEFKEIHRYYTSRKENPLKKMQSLMVLSNKLIRVFYTMLRSGADYDPEKLISDIRRPDNAAEAA